MSEASVVAERPATLVTIADLLRDAVSRGVPAYVIINNKAEGSSPLSLFALARELVDADDVPF